MAHQHRVYDTDARFTIDAHSREIKNAASKKITVVQYDHKSERFTFELPRYIEGHDMSECNKVEVHYINIDSTTKAKVMGLYEVDDLQVNPDNEEKVICSWLIDGNATQYAGQLCFLVRYCCLTDTVVDYAWNTAIFSDVYVTTGLNASETIVEEYIDILERWKESLFNAGYINADQMQKDIANLAVNLAAEKGRIDLLSTYVTPQMFGAKGDGKTDDAESFQSAINYLAENGGGTLAIPTGTYNVSRGEIEVKSNIKIVGIGYPKLIAKSKSGYFSIFTNNKNNLENVEISGLIIDQWEELAVQPDNTSIPCCCIAFVGKCKNITITNNLFYSIGGWTIAVTDTADNYGSSHVFITDNRINWKQAGNGTWYDASAIYAESDSHVIEHNFIESFIGTRSASSRWKSEGGIETHGVGVVRWNEIHNVQAGINVVEHAYDRTTELKAKREIAYNAMRGVCRGVWFWIPKNPYGIENVEIYSNDIEVVAEGYYAGYGAICCTLSEKNYTDTTNHYNGYLKDVKIHNNKFRFIDNSYGGNEYLDVKNVGAISFGANGIVKNVEIYNNDIGNFPWPAISTYQWDADVSRYFGDFDIYGNMVTDCGYNMSNEYQNCVFLINHADRVYVHDNTVKWVNQDTTKYLIGGGYEVMEYVNNKQVSENGFTVYGTLVSSASQNKVGIVIDTKNLGYRTNAGSPNGVLLPKKIGERVFDTTYKRWFIAVGEENTAWRTDASKEKGVVTMPAGDKGVSVYHNLVYTPTNVQITPLGYLGNVYISFLSSDRFIISCTEASESAVKICWEAEI